MWAQSSDLDIRQDQTITRQDYTTRQGGSSQVFWTLDKTKQLLDKTI